MGGSGVGGGGAVHSQNCHMCPTEGHKQTNYTTHATNTAINNHSGSLSVFFFSMPLCYYTITTGCLTNNMLIES